MSNTILGKEAEITGKVAFICGILRTFNTLKLNLSKEYKYQQIKNFMEDSNLFSEKEISVWYEEGLEGLCEFYELDNEFEGTLMCFINPEEASIMQSE